MTPEAQRIAIAEACGWKKGTTGLWQDPDKSGYYPCPDYLNDLNAMHEAEKVVTDWWAYSDNLEGIVEGKAYNQGLIQATAAQRAEAFLRTLGLWKENQ